MNYTLENCYYVGRVVRSNGLNGDLMAVFDVDNPNDYAQMDSALVLDKRGALVPYFIEKVEIRPGGVLLHFEDTDYESAQALVGKELYLPLEVLPPLTGNQFYFHEVKGFEVIDASAGQVGKLREIMDNGPQPVLCIDHPAGKEVLIPLIDEFLEKVDRDQKRLYVRAPEGLIDFYLDM